MSQNFVVRVANKLDGNNGAPIVKAEFDRAMEGYLRQFKSQTGSMHGGVATANDQMKAEVIQQLVDLQSGHKI